MIVTISRLEKRKNFLNMIQGEETETSQGNRDEEQNKECFLGPITFLLPIWLKELEPENIQGCFVLLSG